MFFKKNKKINMQQAKVKLIQEKIVILVSEALKSGIHIEVAPNSDQYFLVDTANQICIGITQYKIVVANHDFNWSDPLSLEFVERVKKIVKAELEKRTLALKKTLFKNEVDLLDKLIKIYKNGE